MQSETHKDKHYFRAAGVFAACLLAVFALPVIAINAHSVLPRTFTNLFFFSTQLLFPYEGLVLSSSTGSHFVFSPGVGRMLTFIHWSLVATAFIRAARRFSMPYVIATALATILLVGIATHLVFGLFGVRVELDGP